jgi:hypothetical protein
MVGKWASKIRSVVHWFEIPIFVGRLISEIRVLRIESSFQQAAFLMKEMIIG